MKFRLGKWIFLLSLFCIVACGQQLTSLTNEEKNNLTKLTENLNAHCVGRYLIDMPEDTLVSGGAKIQGVTIESEIISQDVYQKDIANRGSELRGQKSIDAYPFLYADDEVDGPNTHYFIHRGGVSKDPGNRVFEAYKWDHGYRFKFRIDGTDFLHPDQTQDPLVKQIGIKSDVPEKTHLIFDLVKRLRWRESGEIPMEPGICFLGAFLPGKATGRESAWAQFVLEKNPDVSLIFKDDFGGRNTATLLQRSDQIVADLKAVGGRAIRKGTFLLPSIDAEEWLFAGKRNTGVQGTKCLLEANSITSNSKSSLLTLELDTGSSNAFMQENIKSASMSESEAVALWDVVSRTLRPRPNAF